MVCYVVILDLSHEAAYLVEYVSLNRFFLLYLSTYVSYLFFFFISDRDVYGYCGGFMKALKICLMNIFNGIFVF